MSANISLPLCLFPSAHWLALASPIARINPREIYLKQTYRNRYDLLGVNGRLSLTVPVEGQKGVKTPINNIRIIENGWRKQHVSTLRAAYGRAAYFEHYFDRLESVLLKQEAFLFDLNMRALDWIQSCGIDFKINLTLEPWSYREGDYTYLWEPSQRWPILPSYPQVFSDRHAFESGLSCIDLLMNKGPRANEYLARVLTDSAV